VLRPIHVTLAFLTFLAAWSLGAPAAHAQGQAQAQVQAQAHAPTPSASAAPAALPAITHSATRTDRRVYDVPASMTVMPAAAIEATGARDLKDLFRNQVDLSVGTGPTRFGAAFGSTGRAGNEGLNIRGLEGNPGAARRRHRGRRRAAGAREHAGQCGRRSRDVRKRVPPLRRSRAAPGAQLPLPAGDARRRRARELGRVPRSFCPASRMNFATFSVSPRPEGSASASPAWRFQSAPVRQRLHWPRTLSSTACTLKPPGTLVSCGVGMGKQNTPPHWSQ